MFEQLAAKLFRRMPSVIVLVGLLVLTPLLGACDISVGKPEVVVVTATQQPQSQVVIVTATPTQGAVIPEAPAVQAATPDVQATVQAALAATLAAQPTNTQVPPTDTAVPPTPDLPATLQAMLQLTLAAAPTNTPVPPTNTPVPATNTPKPTSKPAPTKTPANLPPPQLMSPAVDFSCFNIGGCTFSWAWGGSLAANQYFQVQLVGPGNEHRGIHPPTKGYSFQSNWTVYEIIPDWCNRNYMCHMQWTVALIEWDGVDPGKIGRTLSEAAPRWIWL